MHTETTDGTKESTIAQLKKHMEDYQNTAGKTYGYYWPKSRPCPSCGHCPTCGRSGYQYPNYPYYTDPHITWKVGDTPQVPGTWTAKTASPVQPTTGVSVPTQGYQSVHGGGWG